MIYRVNKIEDLAKIEQEISTEAVVVIDKVLPYDCSGVMFKTNKGWSKIFLDSTQLNRDAIINGSLTVNENFSVIGATDIDLGFTENLTINGNDEVNSKVTIENVDDVNITANEEVTINAPIVTVTGDFVYTPKTYVWDSTNDGDTIPDDVDTLIVNIAMGDVNVYLPTILNVGKKFTIVAETGGAPSSNRLYLDVSGMATINEGATSYFLASHQIGYAVCYLSGWVISK